MTFTILSDASPFGEKMLKAESGGWTTIAHQTPRDVLPPTNDPAVYVLLNDSRTVCYIGETGRGATGGIRRRLTTHQHRISWWTHCIYFTDAAFSNDNLRLWLETKLKASVLPNVIVLSNAANTPPSCENGPIFLDRILEMCFALCVPVFERQPMLTWDSRSALAKAIADKFNGGKSSGHIDQILTPRIDRRTERVVMPGKYRSLLQKLGVKFASDGRVSSWASVPNPLPDIAQPFFP